MAPSTTFKCLGCKKGFTHPTGLGNHQRVCREWKNYDVVTIQKKRRRLEQEQLQVESDTEMLADPPHLENPMGPPENHNLLSSGTLSVENQIEYDDMSETAAGSSNAPHAPAPTNNSTRSGRTVRFPRRFDDYLPATRTAWAHNPSNENRNAPQAIENPTSHPVSLSDHRLTTGIQESSASYVVGDENPRDGSESAPMMTNADNFGVYRVYNRKPVDSDDPPPVPGDSGSGCRPGLAPGQGPPHPDVQSSPYYHPFSNPSAAAMMVAHHLGAPIQSLQQTTQIAHILGGLGSDLSPLDLSNFDAAVENRKLDTHLASASETIFQHEDGWLESSVQIRLPLDQKKMLETEAAKFEVGGIFHRDIIDVISSVYQSDAVKSFNHIPFKEFWKPSEDAPSERLYGEIFSSQAMLDADEEICRLCPDESDLEAISVPLLFYSDSTHLASFGTASCWPVYLFFGCQSKYIRDMPTSLACHHIAYMPSLPDNIQDFYQKHYKTSATAATLTHCKRELMHAIFSLILNDKFVHAYQHGIVLKCGDGHRRRLFPRILMYSADYPEKVLLSTIKSNAEHPCPRCLVKKADTIKMGMQIDMHNRQANIRIDNHTRQSTVKCARKLVFEQGVPLSSNRLKNIFSKFSGIPTHNIFSTKLNHLGLDYHQLFVVDLLHEFELGVWKAIFTHLMRILTAIGGNVVQDLNKRYRQVPTFGKGTIRRFTGFSSSMRKLAARDFEDLLQCALPVFEGLLRTQRENTVLRILLFDLTMWHAYAKLRLHTDTTLNDFRTLTTALGKSVRTFIKEVCSQYDTQELPNEMGARGRRQAALAMRSDKSGTSKGTSQRRLTSARKQLNLSTYKYHALGDYPDLIARFGTTDNASTQTGELQHKMIKRRFGRTNKRKYLFQLATAELRERAMRHVAQRLTYHAKHSQIQGRQRQRRKQAQTETNEANTPGSLDTSQRYYIADTTKEKENILEWVHSNHTDIATKDFIPRLKDHLLTRLLSKEYDGDEQEYTHAERNEVLIQDNRIYCHRTLRVYYTSYDLRRQQDVINPASHPDVMVLSCEDGESVHPFWYARVIKIFHLFLCHRRSAPQMEHTPTETQRMDVLWVRWFGLDTDARGGWTKKGLHGVSFIPSDEPGAFGFLDPAQVIRGVHLIPNFLRGWTDSRLPPSIVRSADDDDVDWDGFYVNMFVDRDMFMRFRGGGVGHRGTRHLDSRLKDSDGNHSKSGVGENLDEDEDIEVGEDSGEDEDVDIGEDSGEDEDVLDAGDDSDGNHSNLKSGVGENLDEDEDVDVGEDLGEDEDVDAGEDSESNTNSEQESSRDMDDEQELDGEDEEADDDEILDEEGYGEL